MQSEAAVGRNTVWGTAPRPEIEIEVTPLPPVFVVGDLADRQRMTKLLDGRDGLSCAPDSELLLDLAGVAKRNWPALSHYGYPEQYWVRRMAGFFDALQNEYATSRRLTRWVATAAPGALGLVDRLFPRCQVVRVVPKAGTRTRRLSERYYQLATAELTERPDAALSGVLGFLDPLVESRTRP